jgi:hypothetical protein
VFPYGGAPNLQALLQTLGHRSERRQALRREPVQWSSWVRLAEIHDGPHDSAVGAPAVRRAAAVTPRRWGGAALNRRAYQKAI